MTAPALTVGALAEHVRAKNAGPFWMTLDVFAGTEEAYASLADPALLSGGRIAAVYRVDQEVVQVFRMPQLRVVKISFPRPRTQGSFEDRDMHSGQQLIPLFELSLEPAANSARGER